MRPTDQLCGGCAASLTRRARKVLLCPRCLGALQKANEELPDFSGVKETVRHRGSDPVPSGAWFLERQMRGCPLSAIVPLFRSEQYVRACLESLLRSLPPGSKIIAVEDGSPDRSGEIAEQVLREHDAGLVVRLDRNTGFAHAVNVGAPTPQASTSSSSTPTPSPGRGSSSPCSRSWSVIRTSPSSATAT